MTVHRNTWPCIVTNFFIIRPTRCTNFANVFLAWNSTCFEQCLCPSSGVHSLYTQQYYVSYRFVDSFRAGPGWNWVPSWPCSKAVYIPVWHIPLLSVQWMISWWWTDELSETCRVSWQKYSCEIFYISLTVHIGIILVNNQIDALFSMYLLLVINRNYICEISASTWSYYKETQLMW
jgi:hypothetical protein